MNNLIIMTFDVLSVSNKQIALTGTSNLIYKICNPTKEMQLKAKKNEVIAVLIDEFIHYEDKTINLLTKEIMTFKELKNKGYL